MLLLSPTISLPAACLNQPRQNARGRGALTNSTKLIGCRVLWVVRSLGTEVNICVCVYVRLSEDLYRHVDGLELGPVYPSVLPRSWECE